MHERIVPVPTTAGKMETFITQPEEGSPFPAVVIYMDFWGVREELFDIARRVGTVGYYCMVPDLYYRQGRVRNEWRNEQNQMISMHRLDPERQRQALAPLQQLSNAMVIEDTGALIEFIDRGEPVRRAASARSAIAWAGGTSCAPPVPILNGLSPEPACMARPWSPIARIRRIGSPIVFGASCIAASPSTIPMRLQTSSRSLPGSWHPARCATGTRSIPAPSTAMPCPTAISTTSARPTGIGS